MGRPRIGDAYNVPSSARPASEAGAKRDDDGSSPTHQDDGPTMTATPQPVEPGALGLTFYGGVGTVTGSRHLLAAYHARLLADCGMFQGDKALRARNWTSPGFDPKSVNALVLTHAHMDHSGYIPRFVRDGYAGPIYCTGATRELAEVILLDSAKLQEEDANHANRHGYSSHTPALPLYTSQDVERAMRQFSTVEYGTASPIGDPVSFTLHNAGPILGSASVEVAVP